MRYFVELFSCQTLFMYVLFRKEQAVWEIRHRKASQSKHMDMYMRALIYVGTICECVCRGDTGSINEANVTYNNSLSVHYYVMPVTNDTLV